MSDEQVQQALSKRAAIAILWNNHVLTWKLDGVQKDLYNAYKNSTAKTIVWLCSRRLGKSYTLCLLAIEQCLQKPNTVIKYIAPTQKHVKMIIRPLFKEILKDCPKELRPEYRTADNIYRFPNGSEVQLAGTDNGRAESLRGGSADICIVDEAGFCDDLKYIVQSILIPTTTTTRGKIILSSTPPKNPDHEFYEYVTLAEYKGNFVKKTIYDAIGSRITPEIIKELIDEMGGDESLDFRREYLCEKIVDEESAVVPEMTDKLASQIVTDQWARPPYYDCYVGGDIGFHDLTVFLFAYYDFRKAKLVVEDELVMSGRKMTTDFMAAKLKEKEAALWTNPLTQEQKEPYLRVSDNNLIVINDLHSLHGIVFQPTQKDDSDAALNNLRVMLKEGRIIIHPRCKTLIFHLKNAAWNKSRRSYKRSPDAGHYDAVDALKYLVRAVHYQKNPFPANYGQGSGDSWWHGSYRNAELPDHLKAIKNIFKVRKST
jgi:hypothetical protein